MAGDNCTCIYRSSALGDYVDLMGLTGVKQLLLVVEWDVQILNMQTS